MALGPGKQQHGVVAQHGVRGGQLELTPLPNAHYVDSLFLAQVGVTQCGANQRRAMDGGLRDEHFVEGPHDMSPGIGAGNAAGEETAHHLGVAHDVIGSRQLQDVFRGGAGADRCHDDLGGRVAGTEGDVHVSYVVVRRNHHLGSVDRCLLKGFHFIQIAHHDGNAHVVQAEGFVEVLLDQHEGVAELLQLVHEGMADRVVVGQYDVLVLFRGVTSRHPGPHLVFHEGLVEKPHKEERQHDEQVDHAGKHHQHGEQATVGFVEGDVAVAEGGHRGERPVKAVHPAHGGISLRLHEVFEDHHVGCHEAQQDEYELRDARGIPRVFAGAKTAVAGMDYPLHEVIK